MFRTATKIAAAVAVATIGVATKFIVDDVKTSKAAKACEGCPCACDDESDPEVGETEVEEE